MKVEQDHLGFLKHLYERKFYEEDQPKSTLQKVIRFQKKMEQFKNGKIQNFKYSPSTIDCCLETQPNKFRPTAYSLNRTRKYKNSKSLEHKIFQGPATLELKIILNRKKTQGMKTTTENVRQKFLYSQQQNRKRSQLNFQNNTIEQSNQTPYKLSTIVKIDKVAQGAPRTAMTSDRKVRTSRMKQVSSFFILNENEQDLAQTRKIDHNTERPFESFQQMQPNQNQNQKYLKEKSQIRIGPTVQKKIIQFKQKEKRIPILTKRSNNFKEKMRNRVFQSHPKDEAICNFQLNPWHVDDSNYV